MAMFNIKTIKLYGWEDVFKNRIHRWQSVTQDRECCKKLTKFFIGIWPTLADKLIKPAIILCAAITVGSISDLSLIDSILKQLTSPIKKLPKLFKDSR